MNGDVYFYELNYFKCIKDKDLELDGAISKV